MRKPNRGTSMKTWAWMVSFGIHAILLGAFAFVRLHAAVSHPPADSAAFVSVEPASRVIRAETIAPKPKLRPIVSERPRVDLPSSSKPKPPADIPLHDSVPAVLSEDLISPSLDFFGNRSAAKRICFVVDCSGSMFGRMGLVREQLIKTVDKLAPDQFFSILFFQEGDTHLESGSGFLQRATGSSKQKALDLIHSVLPSGKTEALGALRRAMELRTPGGEGPEVIYFLTDGFELEESGAVLFVRQVEKMRKELAPGTMIHTIGLWTEQKDRWILETLASESGGSFISRESGQEQ